MSRRYPIVVWHFFWSSLSAAAQPSLAGTPASPPAAPAQEAGTPDYGKVLVTNRLDIDFSKHLVTFIELGADRCIPCKAMQPIMKEIAETYVDKIQVVFYDVWKDPEPGRKYKIQLIPTQVFIDQKGKRDLPSRRAVRRRTRS